MAILTFPICTKIKNALDALEIKILHTSCYLIYIELFLFLIPMQQKQTLSNFIYELQSLSTFIHTRIF